MPLRLIFFLILVSWCPGVAPMSVWAQAPADTQSVALQPGWNALWLTVDPRDPAPGEVLKDLPVEEAWGYFPATSPVQFISDPSVAEWNKELWRVWRPATSTVSFLNDLHGLRAGRTYLIKLSGAEARTLTVTGTAWHQPLSWVADSFNLMGFPLDPAGPGELLSTFFANDAALKAGPHYRLTPEGVWTKMAASDRLRAGVAYWVFAKGAAQFQGPLGLRLESNQLDFGLLDEEKTLTLVNETPYPNPVTVTHDGALPLVVASEDNGRVTWDTLTSVARTIPPLGKITLRVGVRRAGQSGSHRGTLAVACTGVRVRLPVRYQVPERASAASGTAGLWIGQAVLTGVADVNSAAAGTPVGTPAEFDLRLLLHVDAGGTVRLLREVTLLKDPGASGVEAAVLVTDPALLPRYQGTLLKNGKLTGQRVSAIGFDFPGNDLPLVGVFGGELTGSFTLPRRHPTNPFRHRYHPDHDDKDATFADRADPPAPGTTADQEEVWAVGRSLALTFDAPSADDASPASGYSTRTGTYREVLTGLHRQAITVTGAFTLQRVNTVTRLNPVP